MGLPDALQEAPGVGSENSRELCSDAALEMPIDVEQWTTKVQLAASLHNFITVLGDMTAFLEAVEHLRHHQGNVLLM